MNFVQIDRSILEDNFALSNGHAGLDEKYIKVITRWVRNYLCKPHSKLGRAGPACPFTGPAVKLGQVWVAVAPNTADTIDSVAGISLAGKDFFQNAPENEREPKHLKAAMVLFPHLNTPEGHAIIERTQRLLKPVFVADGLMFGQFYQGCPEPGLWNPMFRPLFSPIPLLVIRYMVAPDIAFLKHDPILMAHYNFYTQEMAVARGEGLALPAPRRHA
jgi:hypothetical protein